MMKTSSSFTYFCGVDVGRRQHAACLIDREGRVVVRAQSLANDATGYRKLNLPPQALIELICKTSRGQYDAAMAQRLLESAADTVGIRRGREGFRIGIRTLLAQLDAVEPVHRELERRIVALAERLPPCLMSLPGISPLSAAGLFGEIDPIETFKSPSQLVAFAGLDPTVFQSSEYQAPCRRISKRGSPHLRCVLWEIAHRAVHQEGALREYWLRRRQAGLRPKSAAAAAAIKLTRIVWRILTDRRDYRPERPHPKR